MSRQINLLVQAQAPPEFSARRALIGLGVFLGVLLGYSAFVWLGTARLGDEVSAGSADLAKEKAAVTVLERQLSERPKLPDILAQIEALKAQAAESQEIINLLRSGGAGSAGYSAQFAALASISEDGVWLTGVKIGDTGKTVSLSGRALRKESVLRYALRLNERFSAYGAQFTALELTPDAPSAAAGPAGPVGPAVSSVAFKLY